LARATQAPLLIVLMGPSGCGKSTLAAEMARQTSADIVASDMIEADDHHPPANTAKMATGTPLSDTDRIAWLNALTASIRASEAPVVWLACSALSPYVQTRLREETGRAVRFVLLDVPKDVLRERIERRSNHYMPASLLDSQIEALDIPDDAFQLSADQPLDELSAQLLRELAADLCEQTNQHDDRKAD